MQCPTYRNIVFQVKVIVKGQGHEVTFSKKVKLGTSRRPRKPKFLHKILEVGASKIY